MNFRNKFINVLDKVKCNKTLCIFLAFFIVVFFSFISLNKTNTLYKNNLDAQHTRAFNDLTEFVADIETAMLKCAAVSNTKTVIRLASDVYAKAAAASVCLGQLPLSESNLEKTAKFLTQVGDFTYTLALGYMDTEEITPAQRNTMVELSDYAKSLEDGLFDVQQQYYSGKLHFISEKKDSGTNFADNMESLEMKFKDYPTLIYDGPFSDHIEDKESLFLKDAMEVSIEEALQIAESLVSEERRGEIRYDGEVHAKTPLYAFTIQPKSQESRTINIQISKKGGMVISMLDNREVTAPSIDIEKAKENAKQFLQKINLLDMQDSYYEINNNIATINFAYTKDEIVFYPDLCKVKIAMDSGEVLGYEAAGYASNHTERLLNKPRFSVSEALLQLSPALTVEHVRPCVIPTNEGKEAYCYEFKCTLNGRTFLIYINTETGLEEDILLLFDTGHGTLTV